MEMPSPPPVVVITADSGLKTAIDAVKAGAQDFIAKPYEIDALRHVVEKTLEQHRLKRENLNLNPEANWDIRRFRPNFFVETVDGLQGLAENDWAGKTLKIGSATLEITMPTPRCGMTVRPQGELEYDKTILRTIVKDAGQNLGVGAHCLEAGEIRVGDTVEVLS
jgi:hypothetical protein